MAISYFIAKTYNNMSFVRQTDQPIVSEYTFENAVLKFECYVVALYVLY